MSRRSLLAGALAMRASWPAAGSPLALLQLLPGPADAALAGLPLLGVFDPADELVPRQGRDVPPSIERRRAGDQRLAQVCGQLVHDPTRYSRAAHEVAEQGLEPRTRGL